MKLSYTQTLVEEFDDLIEMLNDLKVEKDFIQRITEVKSANLELLTEVLANNGERAARWLVNRFINCFIITWVEFELEDEQEPKTADEAKRLSLEIVKKIDNVLKSTFPTNLN